MKALVLGMGLQGKAVVHDLEQSDLIREIIVADMNADEIQSHLVHKKYTKARAAGVNAARQDELSALIRESGADVVVCMLPPDFGHPVARTCLEFGTPFVSSSYTGKVAELDGLAKKKGISVLPEMGMDPGIDLVLARLAINELDAVHGLYSYGAGLPERSCAEDNPLHYKITWTFEGVLKAYIRPAKILKNGMEVSLPGETIFQEENGHSVEVPGLGTLEAYPNGDAVHYIDVFGLTGDLKEMGRFALRYPGHRQFWQVMAKMGFLDDTPMQIDTAAITPRQFVARHLTPRLQFRETERDMVILRVKAWGLKDGRKKTLTYDLIDYRDLSTGLFAMNRTVGYTTSIGAQMILSGKIKTPGVLSPVRDVPGMDLVKALEARGMQFSFRTEDN